MAEQNAGQGQNQGQAPQQNQIQVKISDEILKGAYSNQAIIAHNREEFQINFMNLDLTSPMGMVVAKILLSPGHMKRMISAMQDNLKRYESSFGSVREADAPAGSDKIGFRAE